MADEEDVQEAGESQSSERLDAILDEMKELHRERDKLHKSTRKLYKKLDDIRTDLRKWRGDPRVSSHYRIGEYASLQRRRYDNPPFASRELALSALKHWIGQIANNMHAGDVTQLIVEVCPSDDS